MTITATVNAGVLTLSGPIPDSDYPIAKQLLVRVNTGSVSVGNGYGTVVTVTGDGSQVTVVDTRGVTSPTGGRIEVEAGTGDNTLTLIGPGNLNGGAGKDHLSGSDGRDFISGWIGNSGVVGVVEIENFETYTTSSSDDSDTLLGLGGDDYLRGFDGPDSLVGGLGNDNLRGDAGNDTLDGGSGYDVASYRFDNIGATMGIVFSAVALTGTGSPVTSFSDGRGGLDSLTGIEGVSVRATGYADTITGGGGNDAIDGRFGSDLLSGGAGDDELRSSSSGSTLHGGPGNDTVIGPSGAWALYDFTANNAPITFTVAPVGADGGSLQPDGQGGTDTLRGVWVRVLGGADSDNLLGNDQRNYFQGNAGSDTLTGGAGNDVFAYDVSASQFGADQISDFTLGDEITFFNSSGTDFNITSPILSGDDPLTLASGEAMLATPAGGTTRLTVRLSLTSFITVDLAGNFSASQFKVDSSSSAAVITLLSNADSADAPSPGTGTPSTGNDSIVGTTGADTINGLSGNDTIVGLDHIDTIFGETGNDLINGGPGNDFLYGWKSASENTDQVDGDDTVFGDDGNDRIYGGPGADSLDGGSGHDVIFGSNANVYSSITSDVADTITGGIGNDTISAGAGADVVDGGDGNDYLSGGPGADTLDGGPGTDFAVFGHGDWFDGIGVTIDGSALVNGGGIITDAWGDKNLLVNIEGIAVNGSASSDSLTGSLYGDELDGLAGDDTIIGAGGNDTLTGGDGSDLISGGDGFDTAILGATTDVGSKVHVDASTFVSGASSKVGNDSLDGIEAIILRGGHANDTLIGSAGNDRFENSEGGFPGSNDIFTGGLGDDDFHFYLWPAYSQDFGVVTGPIGIDTITDFSGGDRIVLNGRSLTELKTGDRQLVAVGDIHVDYQSGSTRLHLGVEGTTDTPITSQYTITLTGRYSVGDLKLSLRPEGSTIIEMNHAMADFNGTDADDVFNGTAADNYISAKGGNNTVTGGQGADSFRMWHTGTTVITDFSYAEGDRINTPFLVIEAGTIVQTVVSGNLEITSPDYPDAKIVLQGINASLPQDAFRTLQASAYDDVLVGNGDGNSFGGLAGNDTIEGRGGDDFLRGDAGNDQLDGGTGNDIAAFQMVAGNSFTVTAADQNGNSSQPDGEGGNDILTSIEEVHVYGTSQGDSITGDARRNYIEGNGGNDTLTGGSGSDSFAYRVGTAVGTDRITDFAQGDNLFFGRPQGETVFSLDTTIIAGNAPGAGQVAVESADGVTKIHVNTGDGTSGIVTVELAGTFGVNDFTVFNDPTFGANINLNAASGNFEGTDADDTHVGNSGDNYINAKGGNNTVTGGAGADTFEFWHSGTTTITDFNAAQGDLISLPFFKFDGASVIQTPVGGNLEITSPEFPSAKFILQGINAPLPESAFRVYPPTPNNDFVGGTNSPDNINGAAGNDTIHGRGGNDFLFGGVGNDVLDGHLGDDFLRGDAGIDQLNGGAGNDIAAFQMVAGNSFTVTAADQNGNSSQPDGEGGNDILTSIEEVHVYGTSQADTITGDARRNYIEGNGGNDTLTGGEGSDTFAYAIGTAVGRDRITLFDQFDDLFFFVPQSTSSFTLSTTIVTGNTPAVGQVAVEAPVDLVTRLYVNTGDPTTGTIIIELNGEYFASDFVVNNTSSGASIRLDPAANDFIGTDADDTFAGSAGNNYINAKGGNNTVTGNGGADTFEFWHSGTTTVTDFNAAEGDLINLPFFKFDEGSVIQTPVGGNLEITSPEFPNAKFILQGINAPLSASAFQVSSPTEGDDFVGGTNSNDNLNGLNGNDTIHGRGGNDFLHGGTGNDVLDGHDGSDFLRGDVGNDQLNGGAGNDVAAFQMVTGNSFTVSAADQNGNSSQPDGEGGIDILTSIEEVHVYGTSQGDTITGDNRRNYIAGHDGNDSLAGNGGNDHLVGGAGNDLIDGGADYDTTDYSLGTVATIHQVPTTDTISVFVDNTLAVTITKQGNGTITVADVRDGSPLGTDTLAGVEGLSFNGNTSGESFVNLFVRIAENLSGDGTNLHATDFVETIDIATRFPSLDANTFFYANAAGGNDTLIGHAGNNGLEGGAGNDTIQGGAGFDTANYGIGGQQTVSIVQVGESGLEIRSGETAVISFTRNGDGTWTSTDLRPGTPTGSDTIHTDVEQIYANNSNGQSASFAIAPSVNGQNITGTAFSETLSVATLAPSITTGQTANVTGGGGADVLIGHDGNGYFEGGTGNDTLTGGAGNDEFRVQVGTAVGTDRINDFGPGDFIRVATANNQNVILGTTILSGDTPGTLTTGQVMVGATVDGITKLYINTGDATTGTVTIELAGSYSVNNFFVPSNSGSIQFDGNDVLVGNANNNFLDGRNFNDTIEGLGGIDNLSGGAGNDFIDGGDGNDNLYGGLRLNTNPAGEIDGNDTILAGAGDDFVRGGAGADSISGGSGNDFLYGSNSSTHVPSAEDHGDTIDGGEGNDILRGNAGNDLLLGGVGNDNLRGDSGNNTLDGGDGTDFASFFYGGDTDTNLTAGFKVDASGLDANGNGTVVGAFGDTNTLFSIEGVALAGNQFDDTLIGSQGGDQIFGNGGNDIVTGGAGNDFILDGGDGNDTVSGGSGDDTLYGGDGADELDGGDGSDIAYLGDGEAETGYTIDASALNPAAVITLFGHKLTNIEAVGLGGSAFADTLVGSSGNDLFQGDDGNDQITGGAGDDEFLYQGFIGFSNGPNGQVETYGKNGQDTITDFGGGDRIIIGGQSLNAIAAGGPGGLLANDVRVQNLGGVTLIHVGFDNMVGADLTIILTGTFAASDFTVVEGNEIRLSPNYNPGQTVTGTSASEVLTGTSANDILWGEGGDDTLQGLDGNDSFIGGFGNDSLLGGAGNDTLHGSAGDDFIDGGDGDDNIDETNPTNPRGNDTLLGGSGNDRISANYGNEFIDAGAGNDTIYSSFGADTITSGEGSDVIRIYGHMSAEPADLITDFSTEDRIYLENPDPIPLTTITVGDGSQVARGVVQVNSSGTTTTLSFGTDDTPGADVVLVLNGTYTAQDFGIEDGTRVRLLPLEPLVLSGTANRDLLMGGSKDDTIIGLGGHDDLTGNGGSDSLAGGDGNDFLSGFQGGSGVSGGLDAADTLDGGAGDDLLRGFEGGDVLLGGDGNDNLRGDAGSDTLDGGAGTADFASYRFDNIGASTGVTFSLAVVTDAAGNFAVADGQGGTDQVAGIERFGITGSSFGDALSGSGLADQIFGYAGNDSIQGGGGNDYVLDGGAGNDTIDGGDGDDLAGYDFSDLSQAVSFSAGAFGSTLPTTLADGRGGIDTLSNIEGFTIGGGAASDTLIGSVVADRITGNGGNDTLVGGAGNDTFTFFTRDFAGNLIANGTDRIRDFAPGDLIEVVGTGLTGAVTSGNGSAVTAGQVQLENLPLGVTRLHIGLDDKAGADLSIDLDGFFSTGDFAIVDGALTTNYTATVLTGTSAGDTFGGRVLNDSIDGAAGNDNLFGYGGADTLVGGTGNDTLIGGYTSDSIQPAPDGGDQLDGGSGNDLLRGGSGNDTLLGGDGADNLRGDDGDDVLDGGAGDFDFASYRFDFLNLEAGVNFSLAAVVTPGGSYQISDGRGGTDTISNIERFGIDGSAYADTLVGSAGSDQITGNDGGDSISGGAGNDSLLDGGAGNDTIHGGAGDDSLRPGAGQNTIDGGAGFDVVSFEYFDAKAGVTVTATQTSVTDSLGNSTQMTAIEQIQITGSAFADTITGGKGGDNIFGGNGNDLLAGGEGGDTFGYGSGGTGANGVDRIVDFGDGDTIAIFVPSFSLTGITAGTGATVTAGKVEVSTAGGITTLSFGIDDSAGADLTVEINGTFQPSSFAIVDGNRVTLATGQVINGNETSENLFGGPGPDTINGLGGNDNLFGNAGNDSLSGGAGNDNLNGGLGNDTVDGGAGTFDVANMFEVKISEATITRNGDGSVQVQTAAQGTDTLIGVEGISFSDGFVRLVPSTFTQNDNVSLSIQGTNLFDDSIAGAAGNDYITGEAGNDTLAGGAGGDWLVGGAGNDSIEGGANGQSKEGFAQVDTASFSGKASEYTLEQLGDGSIRVTHNSTAPGNDGVDLLSGVEMLSFSDTSVRVLPETFDRNDGKDIRGTLFAETLTGGTGNDFFDAGAGNDTVQGGDGSDTIFINTNRADATISKVADGVFTITVGTEVDRLEGVEAISFKDTYVRLAPSTYLQGDNVSVGIEGTDEFADSLVAGAGNDYLNGREGNDTLVGGAGGDFLFGSAGNDRIEGGANGTSQEGYELFDTAGYTGKQAGYTIEQSGGNVVVTDIDTTDGNDGVDTLIGVEAVSFSDAWVRITAQKFENKDGSFYIEGTQFSETLAGGTGNDYIRTGGGNDTVDGGAGFDTVGFDANLANATFGKDGQNRLTITIGTTTVTVENVEALGFLDNWVPLAATKYDYDGGFSLNGTDLFNDSLEGGTGNDYLHGRAGNDTLAGGDGGDFLVGGTGNDTLIGGNNGVGFGGYPLPDTAGYDGASTGYKIERSGSNIVVTDIDTTNGDDGVDTLIGVEAISFSDTQIRVAVQTQQNGSDLSVTGTLFDDTLDGGTGNDFFAPRNGNDTVNGGAGTGDTVFIDADVENAEIVRVSATQITVKVGTETDTLNDVEAISFRNSWVRVAEQRYTHSEGESVIGTRFGETLNGGTGNDYLDGQEGADQLNGGTGGDFLVGGSGNDTIDGGGNGTGGDGFPRTDTVGYFAPIAGYKITNQGGGVFTVQDIDTSNGDDGTDTISNVEGLSFSDAYVPLTVQTYTQPDSTNLTIIGSQFADSMEGGAGDDWIRTNEGNDTVDGKAGRDTVHYDLARSAVTIEQDGSDFKVTITATGEVDVIRNVEAVSFNNDYVRLAVSQFDFGDGIAYEGTFLGEAITAGTGHDYVNGGVGNDTLDGGSGGDYLVGGAGNDQINGGANGTSGGFERIDTAGFGGNYSDYEITVGGGTITVKDNRNGAENDGTDTLTGVEALSFRNAWVRYLDNGSVQISGFDGNDSFTGSDQDDFLFGGDGNDSLASGAGNDHLNGGTGNDTLDGGTGDDNIYIDANAADVTLTKVSATEWTVTNKSGEVDTLRNIESVGFRDNFVRLTPTSFNDGNGNLYVEGTKAADTLTGGAGNDFFNGRGGNDSYDGLAGFDTVGIDANLADATITRNAQGVVTVVAGGTTHTLTNVEALSLKDAWIDLRINTDTANAILGSDIGDLIDGSANADYLDGRRGNDTINGGDSADIIRGGRGNDVIDGGANPAGQPDVVTFDGNFADYEITRVGNAIQVVDKNTGVLDEGTDTLSNVEALSFADGFHWVAVVEEANGNGRFIYGGILDDTITGTDFDDGIVGRAGNDSISGGAGGDYIDGQAGNDTIDSGTGADLLVFRSGEGQDRVIGFDLANDQIYLAGLDRTAAINAAALVDGNVQIAIGGGATVTLVGLSLTDLNTINITTSNPG